MEVIIISEQYIRSECYSVIFAGQAQQYFFYLQMSLHVQQQIRQNALEIRDYLSDLYAWEEATNNAPKKKEASAVTLERPPPRGEVELKKTDAKQLRRDANTIKDYYDAWNKFDVDAELEEVVLYQPTQTKQNAQVVIKGGRVQQKSRIALQKEEANDLFKTGQLDQALSKYQECIEELNSKQSLTQEELEQLVIIHSNKAQVYLKQARYKDAIEECNRALAMDQNHAKSLLRRSTSLQELGRWKEALRDCERLVQLGEEEAKVRVQSLKSKIDKKRNAAKNALKLVKPQQGEFEVIQVVDVEEDEQKEGKNYLNSLD